jgi:hypothetical protein
MDRRTLPLVLATLAVLAVILGSGGVTTMTADRNLDLHVTNDRTGYLGINQTIEPTGGEANLTLRVTNQFPDGTRLTTVTVTIGDRSQSLLSGGALSPGESTSETLRGVQCGETVTVEARGKETAVKRTRTVAC